MIAPVSSTTTRNRRCSEKKVRRCRPESASTPRSARLVIRPARHSSRVSLPLSAFDSGDPGRGAFADRLGMVLLQIMGARAELHQFAIVQAGSKTLGKAGRNEGTGISGEKQLWILGRCQRCMRLLEDGIDVRRLARDRQFG